MEDGQQFSRGFTTFSRTVSRSDSELDLSGGFGWFLRLPSWTHFNI